MLIINITSSKHSNNVVEIMFHCVNNEWFTALFPASDVDFDAMKKYYMGKDFCMTKADYKGRIFSESGMDI